jgi:hypothetical protein
MTQDMNANKAKSLLEGIQRAFYGKAPDRQAQAVAEALLYAFQTIERLESRIKALEASQGVEARQTGGDQVGNG